DHLPIMGREGFEGLKVAICGDILHSRVARSNVQGLTTMGAEVRFVGPPTLMPARVEEAFNVKVFHRMEEGIAGVNVVMMLRLQQERMAKAYVPSIREYFHYWGLTRKRLALASETAIVMHPGPMNRGVEIASEVADDLERSVILEQVANGLAVRMAVLYRLCTPQSRS
ncbi:MAG TPA: aspartate carbamoyltransferase, partial [Magnetococcales bacterium]|nr:aspartate carbamoyltransferase [Magnetococcales bacterium]